jgi:uroporphyrin-III C-methyltransferase
MSKSSKLILVGAGPGDPELITIKGLKALKEADYILYDGLVNLMILDLAERDLNDDKIIFVGKKSGESYKQKQINELILKLLQQGNKVVRLKGGDPLVFGRASEEIEIAQQNGFSFEVIPGLTSAFGLASLHNISLTLRNKSDSVTLVTGHEINTKKLKLWAEIINSGATLVIYMGIGNIVKISQDISLDIDPKTPAVVIANGSLLDEKIILSSINNLAQDIINNNISSPALIYLGHNLNFKNVVKNFYKNHNLSSLINNNLAGQEIPIHTSVLSNKN